MEIQILKLLTRVINSDAGEFIKSMKMSPVKQINRQEEFNRIFKLKFIKMKYIILIIMFSGLCLNLLSQNITNTIGINGVFKIKDGATDFFTLNQSNGTIILPNEAGNIRGSIYKGGYRFLHSYYGTNTHGLNTFLGINSGNFTMGGLYAEGSYNTGVGGGTLSHITTGNQNSAFGNGSLHYNTTGFQNTAFGINTLLSNTSGFHNIAIGTWSLGLNGTGNYNIAIGNDALYNNVYGNQNTAVGHLSLEYNRGYYNTAIGYNSGSTVTTGYNLTLIGIDASPSSPTTGNQVTLGNQFVTSLRCNVTTITSLSDRRDKNKIEELSLGLDFITRLKPRQFNWDRREWYEEGVSDGSKMNELPTAGFIAQELDSAQTDAGAEWLNLVLKDNPEKWEATPGNLLPVIVKAIQELNDKNEKLSAENTDLKERLENYEQIQTMLAKEIDKLKLKEKNIKEINSEVNTVKQ